MSTRYAGMLGALMGVLVLAACGGQGGGTGEVRPDEDLRFVPSPEDSMEDGAVLEPPGDVPDVHVQADSGDAAADEWTGPDGEADCVDLCQADSGCELPCGEPMTDQCSGSEDECDVATDEGAQTSDLDGDPGNLDDGDADGVPDAVDNCPFVANPDQADFDQDQVGDKCDPDDDNDTTPDAQDCAPLDPAIHPGAAEVCDGIDNDCDVELDEEMTDYDCGTPKIVSEPVTSLDLAQELGSQFNLGEAFISSSRTDEIRVYDAETLTFLQSFTHPKFSEVDSPSYTYGPNGMAFNDRRNLVVAAYGAFVEFSSYGVEYAVYPKEVSEATENIAFDNKGNLYTTTATGGSDKLNQYRAIDYKYQMTIDLPAGAGQLTGITFDYYYRLFLASQSDNKIHVFEFDSDFTTFKWIKALDGTGNPASFEGIRIAPNGEVLAAAGDIVRYDYWTGVKLGSFDAPDDYFPVPLTVDNWGRIYTSDYENGSGTLPADIYRFSSDGADVLSANDPGLFGPFGLAISGTVLPGDKPVLFTYQVEAIDITGDALVYTLLKGPDGMFIDAGTGLIHWYITCAQLGSHPVSVKVEDPAGNFDIQEFVLVVK